LITKLREKMGRLVVFAVGFAILSFVLADLLGPGSTLFGGQDTVVGEISGKEIDLEEYQQSLDQLIGNYEMQFGRTPSEQVMVTLREQAWELMIAQIAYQKQYDALGVTVSDDEVWDMVQGKNVSPDIKNAPIFQDENTGQFDRSKLIQFLQQLPSLPPQNQSSWYMFEANLQPGRQRVKYENMLVMANYVTEAEAAKKHFDDNTIAETSYLYVPYYAVGDSVVGEVTDAQLRSYISENEEDFKTNSSRSVKYVQFEIVPSEEDTAYFREEIESIKKEFEGVSDDSVFARITSDSRDFFATYNISNLPSDLRSRIDELEEGKVYGPDESLGSLKIFKVTELSEDTIYYAKASHILFKPEDETASAKAEARAEANRILREIQNGASFESMAREHGSDGTAARGGDLGWGQQGRTWVEEFEKPLFAATQEGLINRIVETEFGYHILKVTGVKDNRVFKIASIDREIVPSDETTEVAFRKAGTFASGIVNLNEFEAAAEEQSLEVFEAPNLGQNERNIRGLGAAREIIRWAFNDASKNEVSDVFELDEAFVVAVLTDITEEGIADLESVRSQVTASVKNQLKGDIIIERLSNLSGSLDSMAAEYGTDARVYSMSDLNMSANSMTGVGFDPSAVGRVLGLEQGERSAPFKSENGVVIAEMKTMTEAVELADYSSILDELRASARNQASFKVAEAIKEKADIKDERYKFY